MEQEGDPVKKKRVRKRPGRHLLQNRRVAQREGMVQNGEDVDVEQLKMLSLQKPKFLPSSPYFPAYEFLEKNFICKKVVTPPMPKNPQNAKKLSIELVRLLRWQLPFSGIPFSAEDGSAEVRDVATHLGVTVEAVIEAASTGGKGGGEKLRMVVIELISSSQTVTRISAVGGHGFRVNCQPGHRLVPLMATRESSIAPLFHETSAVEAIRQTNNLSSMDRVGGINFHPRKAGNYRPNAGFDILMGETQLNQALGDGLFFFENHFSGLIFGMGKWKEANAWWDGLIPLKYLEIRKRV